MAERETWFTLNDHPSGEGEFLGRMSDGSEREVSYQLTDDLYCWMWRAPAGVDLVAWRFR